MKLLWKLLRQHISVAQFTGFFLANLVGVLIILLGVQFYNDIQAVYNGEDSFMKADYLIVNKKVGALNAVNKSKSAFSESELDDLQNQKFVKQIGQFTPSAYQVYARFNLDGANSIGTDMFFESVPDEFVDVKSDDWQFTPGDKTIPIILPKNYLDLYNFGYAQGKDMPQISEGLLGAIRLEIHIGNRLGENQFEGKIAGFSSRLNTILVPESFMKWANENFANSGEKRDVSRLIVEVNDPTDDAITSYLQDNNYETDADKLDASKTTFMLRILVSIVMIVGIIICSLSIYILMLSVFLLVQKNSAKLQNLLLIGYSPGKVSLPYQLLTIGLNALVLILALVTLIFIRRVYLDMLQSFFPDMDTPSMLPAVVVGVIVLIIVSIFNVFAVRGKVMNIWKNKE